MDVVGGLTAAKLALDLVKDLREIDQSVDEAAFKLKLAELTSALADTKVALSDARVRISELEQIASELKGGPLCPVCLSGRVRVVKVKPNEFSSETEFHECQCENGDCGYTTTKVYLTGSGKYKGQ